MTTAWLQTTICVNVAVRMAQYGKVDMDEWLRKVLAFHRRAYPGFLLVLCSPLIMYQHL